MALSQPNSETFIRLAETFQVMGDVSRVKIIWALAQGEHSVGELAEHLKMGQSSVSHHLRTLRNLQLVKQRREGQTIFYELDDDHIGRLLLEGIEHVKDYIS